MKDNFYKIVPLKDGREAVLRPLMPSDAREMIAVMKQTADETRFLTYEPGEFPFTLEQEQAVIEKSFQNENVLWLAAVIDGRIAGTCEGRMISGKSRLRHRVGLGISILQQYWGLGLGRALMGEIILWARQKGFEQIELGVVANNERAISLYKSLGFEITGTVPRHMKYHDGTYSDEYLMTLFL
ncbi:MAG: GNAT family N-acetyltransferase [Christensenellales bacterium]|jgi:RimJ/RimL family protein N-acetyltransferase